MTAAAPKPLAGVVGAHAENSLSPLLHQTWLEREDRPGAYLAIPIRDEGEAFERAVRGLAQAGFSGVNVTIPYKERALALADSASGTARAVGAANMLTFRSGKVYADNSDREGFQNALKASYPAANHKDRALVLGAGGAARSVVDALRRFGFSTIAIANRTRARADQLAGLFEANAVEWDARGGEAARADLIVNATSLGMMGSPPLDLDLSSAKPGAVVCDIVYSPLKTALLRDAAKTGLVTIDGLAMLMAQARPGASQWLGLSAVIDGNLRRTMVRALEDRP